MFVSVGGVFQLFHDVFASCFLPYLFPNTWMESYSACLWLDAVKMLLMDAKKKTGKWYLCKRKWEVDVFGTCSLQCVHCFFTSSCIPHPKRYISCWLCAYWFHFVFLRGKHFHIYLNLSGCCFIDSWGETNCDFELWKCGCLHTVFHYQHRPSSVKEQAF